MRDGGSMPSCCGTPSGVPISSSITWPSVRIWPKRGRQPNASPLNSRSDTGEARPRSDVERRDHRAVIARAELTLDNTGSGATGERPAGENIVETPADVALFEVA